jgi:hypothetical protein
MTDDPNELQNVEAQKLVTAGHERELRQRTEKIREALTGVTAEDRQRMIDDALRTFDPM